MQYQGTGRRTMVGGFRVAVFTLLFVSVTLRAAALKEDIETYFADLREAATAIMKDPAVKKTRLASTDRFFVRSLKKQQTIYALIRTNSKGIVISEVIRGETPERDYRNIANQKWFQYIARNNKEYHGFLKEDGRYYLFWAEPVILTARSGKKRFIGAVAAKIDIWDCLHKFSAQVETPFLIRLNSKGLYSHKWEKETEFEEEQLDILGVDRISVRLPSRATAAVEDDSAALARQAEVEAEAAAMAAALAEQEKKKPLFRMESYTPLIIAGVALLLVLLVALIRVIMWVRYKRLVSKIDKEDVL